MRPVPVERPQFPVDEGAHPGVKTEWWYLHGHLQDEQGTRYGYMQALFDVPDVINARYNVDVPAMPGGTQLDTALVNVDSGDHQAHRELHLHLPYGPHRGINAGTLDERFSSSKGEFSVRRTGPNTIHMEAPLERGRLSLDFTEEKPALMMGGSGEIPMGPYGLSKYYTLPKMRAEGTVTVDGQTKRVSGTGWLDHQWGDMQIFNGYQGWDWFGVQLDSGEQLNCFNFRGEDGKSVQGTVGFSRPDGTQEHGEDLKVEPLGDYWTSPSTGARYPLAWHVVVPSKNVDLTVTTKVQPQEMVGTWPYDPQLAIIPTYWEGASDVTGTIDGRPVQGKAYTELTGYATPEGDSNSAIARARARLQAGDVVD
ncbi:MAG: hypothetical protein FJX76_11330 [Armatimonadetes bacterium]|nr:hypothetical protein [Armatimonadota bacterium]